jgi:hypothetical protein
MTLKTRNKQKSKDTKLLAEKDKNTRKISKREQKAYLHKYVRHRGHHDSHHATMGTTWRPRQTCVSSENLK